MLAARVKRGRLAWHGSAKRLPRGFMPAVMDAFTRSSSASERVKKIRALLEQFNQPENVLPEKIRRFLRHQAQQVQHQPQRRVAAVGVEDRLCDLRRELDALHADGDFSSARHAAVCEAISVTELVTEAVRQMGERAGTVV
jgi:hypothetical protein